MDTLLDFPIRPETHDDPATLDRSLFDAQWTDDERRALETLMTHLGPLTIVAEADPRAA